MKIGVVSDSHGNVEYLRRATDLMIEENVDMIIHLGDDRSDMLELGSLSARTVAVPGVFEETYRDASVPNRIIADLDGLTTLISHTPKSHENDLPHDPKPEEIIANKKADVVLFGHTHQLELKVHKGMLFVNPGYLKKDGTFALLEIEGRKVNVRIMNLDKRVKREKRFQL